MQLTVEDLEKERDFYFGKLRDIEVICQEEEGANSDLIQRILAILYATAVCIWPNHLTALWQNEWPT